MQYISGADQSARHKHPIGLANSYQMTLAMLWQT
jgi:hypothetical protein